MHGGKFLLGTCQSCSMRWKTVGMSFSVVNPEELAYRDDIFLKPPNTACNMGLGFVVGLGILLVVVVLFCSQYHLIS